MHKFVWVVWTKMNEANFNSDVFHIIAIYTRNFDMTAIC